MKIEFNFVRYVPSKKLKLCIICPHKSVKASVKRPYSTNRLCKICPHNKTAFMFIYPQYGATKPVGPSKCVIK